MLTRMILYWVGYISGELTSDTKEAGLLFGQKHLVGIGGSAIGHIFQD